MTEDERRARTSGRLYGLFCSLGLYTGASRSEAKRWRAIASDLTLARADDAKLLTRARRLHREGYYCLSSDEKAALALVDAWEYLARLKGVPKEE
jgi:hypothetical protein